MLDDVLAATEGLPVVALAAGDVLFDENSPSSTVFVIVDGELEVRRGDVLINRLSLPGSFVGEIGALLGQPRNATVLASLPTVVREIGDPRQFFASHPEIGFELARQLAAKLHRLTAYIADVEHQFADHDGHLGMVGEVLGRIATRPAIDIEPGSDRSPDY